MKTKHQVKLEQANITKHIAVEKKKTHIRNLIDWMQLYLKDEELGMAQQKAREIALEIEELEYMESKSAIDDIDFFSKRG
jgi:hypothetical protein